MLIGVQHLQNTEALTHTHIVIEEITLSTSVTIVWAITVTTIAGTITL